MFSFDETLLVTNCKKLLHYAQSEKKRDVVMLVNNYLAFDNPTEGIVIDH